MKVSTEQAENRQAVIQIEVEPNELEAALERAYRRVVRQVNINGFRPGKAPRRIVEARLGRGVLIEEAARDLVPKLTNDVVEEQKLDIIAEPSVEITSIEPLAFTATVPLRPTVTLGDYTSIRLEPRAVEVTDEQADDVINRLREQRAAWEAPATPRPAADGDQLTLNLASSVDGEPLEEPQEGVTTILGEQGLLPELQEAVRGLSVGESAQARVTFPEDSSVERIRGKEVTFDLTVTDLKEKRLPEADDEFARTVSDAQTMDELRDRVRQNLLAEADQEARREVTNALIALVADMATIEMPPVLVENEIDRQIQERRRTFERQGLKWERVLELMNRTEEELREQEREAAERRVRSSLALLEVARAEELSVPHEEVHAEMDRIVESYPEQQRKQARRQINQPEMHQTIENSLLEGRIINRLAEIASEGKGFDALLTYPSGRPMPTEEEAGVSETTAETETSTPEETDQPEAVATEAEAAPESGDER